MNQPSNASREPELSPTIQKLEDALEQLRQNELRRFLKKASSPTASLLEEATRSLMQKVLKQHAERLKAASGWGKPSQLVELLTELFDPESLSVGLAG